MSELVLKDSEPCELLRELLSELDFQLSPSRSGSRCCVGRGLQAVFNCKRAARSRSMLACQLALPVRDTSSSGIAGYGGPGKISSYNIAVIILSHDTRNVRVELAFQAGSISPATCCSTAQKHLVYLNLNPHGIMRCPCHSSG